ncbi:MAG: hypothetical protein PUI84_05650 [Bacteroidales bacterium]|nr:hypothetical protein [Porphyromonas sp.]MDD6934787.1 hypothetical protein [Bacteroidales bacterium]MDY3101910.1 hypothetical protein [Porphyromonas sp.]
MKLKSILLGATVMVAGALTSLNAQAQEVFHKGTSTASVLVGFGGTTLAGSGQKMLVPPIQLTYEYGVVDGLINGNASIGVGAAVGYAANKYAIQGYASAYQNYGFFGARGSFHYQFVDKLDTYAGIFLGCIMSKASFKNETINKLYVDNVATATTFGWASMIGARYYFTPTMAVNAELGYGISIFNVGLTFRF